MIVPGGGLSLDGARWVASRSNFLVHVNVLMRLFRGKMLAMLMAAHDAGQLKFFNTYAGLADKRAFKRFVAPLRHIEWVVHCKAPFAGPQQVLRYLSRYTHRVAISNRRLVAADDAGIAFRWKETLLGVGRHLGCLALLSRRGLGPPDMRTSPRWRWRTSRKWFGQRCVRCPRASRAVAFPTTRPTAPLVYAPSALRTPCGHGSCKPSTQSD